MSVHEKAWLQQRAQGLDGVVNLRFAMAARDEKQGAAHQLKKEARKKKQGTLA